MTVVWTHPGQRSTSGESARALDSSSPIGAFLCRAGAAICLLAGIGGAISYYAGFLDVPVSYPFFALVALGSLARYLRRTADRLAMPAVDELEVNDPRAPIAYLRAFDHDETLLAPRSLVGFPQSETSIEEAILFELRDFGPVIALHNRSLAARPAAFTPLPADNDTWKKEAAELIRRAAMIVVLVKRSRGLEWELDEIRTAQRLNDTVFFFSMTPTSPRT